MNPLAALDKQASEYNDRYAGRNLEAERVRLRDEFAKAAMQAMLGSPHCPRQVDEKELAKQAYEMADAMLAARSAQ